MDLQQAPATQIAVFCSYAHEDESLRNKLEKHLNFLHRQGLISEWHDHEILPDAKWSREIDEHLQTASIILLLISADFLTSDLKHFAFPPQMALVRLDGQYGDATVITQLILAGVYGVPRGRGYQLLEHPQIQGVLAHPPTASVRRMNTGQVVELFEGGWLERGESLPHVRVMVARHPAPAPGKDIAVGKRVGEWVCRPLPHNLAQRWVSGRGCA